jgi:hypothetical protein
MKGLLHIAKIREYCDYLEEHLENVAWAWKVLQEKCKDMKFVWDDFMYATIDSMVEQHDLSKFSAEEFMPYSNKFFSVEGQLGDRTEDEFKKAWEHHQEHNPHHWQSWAHKEFYHPHEAECHCVCMVIDWMAMGKKFNDTAQDYYEKNKKSIKLPDWAVDFIGEIFSRIKEEGSGERPNGNV